MTGVRTVKWETIEKDFAGDGTIGGGGLLLLGNGFSTNIWSAFGYPSLLAKSNLGGVARQIFGHRANFESVLAELSITFKMMTVVAPGDAALSRLVALQRDVRDALLAAVDAVHPEAGDLTAKTALSSTPTPFRPRVLTQLATYMRRHAKVFVTNYDLISYWAAVEGCIADLFRGTDPFDEHQAAIWLGNGQPKIFFLHGALHLWRSVSTNEDGKLTATQTTNLLDVIQSTLENSDRVPLFISEGSSDEKLARISTSPYLSFCNRVLSEANAPLTVLGHSFQDVDRHIREAIQLHPHRKIAVGIWVGKNPGNLESEARRILGRLAQCTDVIFFNSADHPLTNPDLNCK